VSAILFDFDGVLVDSTAAVDGAWLQWAAEKGLPAAEILAVVHGRPARDTVAQFAPQLDQAAEAERIVRYEMARDSAVTAIPGSSEALAVAQRGRWGIVTSSTRALALRRLELIELDPPEVLVTADDVATGKPDPAPYLLAAERLGAAPSDCVAVEDSPAGVLAALRSGMTVFAVATSHDAAELASANRVFPDMHHVAVALAER
jgi:sugar-phosphatase